MKWMLRELTAISCIFPFLEHFNASRWLWEFICNFMTILPVRMKRLTVTSCKTIAASSKLNSFRNNLFYKVQKVFFVSIFLNPFYKNSLNKLRAFLEPRTITHQWIHVFEIFERMNAPHVIDPIYQIKSLVRMWIHSGSIVVPGSTQTNDCFWSIVNNKAYLPK